jgi:hypothetical protein
MKWWEKAGLEAPPSLPPQTTQRVGRWAAPCLCTASADVNPHSSTTQPRGIPLRSPVICQRTAESTVLASRSLPSPLSFNRLTPLESVAQRVGEMGTIPTTHPVCKKSLPVSLLLTPPDVIDHSEFSGRVAKLGCVPVQDRACWSGYSFPVPLGCQQWVLFLKNHLKLLGPIPSSALVGQVVCDLAAKVTQWGANVECTDACAHQIGGVCLSKP